jgi:hypothetical protein
MMSYDSYYKLYKETNEYIFKNNIKLYDTMSKEYIYNILNKYIKEEISSNNSIFDKYKLVMTKMIDIQDNEVLEHMFYVVCNHRYNRVDRFKANTIKFKYQQQNNCFYIGYYNLIKCKMCNYATQDFVNWFELGEHNIYYKKENDIMLSDSQDRNSILILKDINNNSLIDNIYNRINYKRDKHSISYFTFITDCINYVLDSIIHYTIIDNTIVDSYYLINRILCIYHIYTNDYNSFDYNRLYSVIKLTVPNINDKLFYLVKYNYFLNSEEIKSRYALLVFNMY